MSTKKTQEESEQPAKVYQLDAVETKVDQVLAQLTVIKDQTTGVVSQSQLENVIKDQKLYVDGEIGDLRREIHDAYSPLKKSVSKFGWLVVGGVISVLGQIYIIITITGGK